MSNYQTLDYLPDLTSSQMSSAGMLNFSLDPRRISDKWDYMASASGYDQPPMLDSIYKFTAIEGSSYDIFSISFYDPFVTILYDDKGNAIVANSESDDPSEFLGGDQRYNQDVILEWVAPYTGTYYIDASWNQGNSNDYTYNTLNIFKNAYTVAKNTPEPDIPPPDDEIGISLFSDADRIFNYGENAYSDLFSGHSESMYVFGYNARMYSNGNGLGEKEGSIYFYDGSADIIYLVGLVSNYLPDAISAGF